MIKKLRVSCTLILTLVVVTLAFLSCIFSGLESAWADSVIDSIPVGTNPHDVAFNPVNGDMYVVNQVGGGNTCTVSVIDSETNSVIDTINVGVRSSNIAFNPKNGNMYVTNSESDTVSVIDSTTNRVIDTIQVGSFPQGIAFNPKNGNMYVVNSGAQTDTWSVSVIDSMTNHVIDTLHTGDFPQDIAFNPKNGHMYVTNAFDNTVSVIDSETNQIIDTIPVGSFPSGVAFNPKNGDMYVANSASNTVSVIDSSSNQVIDTISVGITPIGIAFNPNNGNMYVTNAGRLSGDDIVSVIDSSTNQVIDNIIVGTLPIGIAFDAANGYIYVTNGRSNTVSVIATSTPIQPPTQTTINSATDGNGNPVEDGGSTVSTAITFQVTATPGANPIAGFECSLDGQPFSTCANTNPATINLNDLAAGQRHTFSVRAVDTQGNKDPNPDTFRWTVLTPKQAIQKIVDNIDSLHLSKGTTTSLEAPLNAASRQLSRDNNNVATCNLLDAFLHQVNSKEANGQLTSKQAADLRQQATAIQDTINCSSPPSSSSNSTTQPLSSSSSSLPSQQQQSSNTNLTMDGLPSTLSLSP